MKRIVLICMFISLVGFAFAPTKTDQFKQVYMSNEETSDHTAGLARYFDDLRLFDPNAGILSLSQLMTGVEAQVVTVAKSGADFTTIQAAIDSVSDSSAAKPYVVLIYPGVYELLSTEGIVLNESYVHLIGCARDGVVIKGDIDEDETNGAILTITAAYASVQNLTLSNTHVWAAAPHEAGRCIHVKIGDVYLHNLKMLAPDAKNALQIDRSNDLENCTVSQVYSEALYHPIDFGNSNDAAAWDVTIKDSIFVRKAEAADDHPLCYLPDYGAVRLYNCQFLTSDTTCAIFGNGLDNAVYGCNIFSDADYIFREDQAATGTINAFFADVRGTSGWKYDSGNGAYNATINITTYPYQYKEEFNAGLQSTMIEASDDVTFDWDTIGEQFVAGLGVGARFSPDADITQTDSTFKRVVETEGFKSNGIIFDIYHDADHAANEAKATLLRLKNIDTATGNFLDCYDDAVLKASIENDGDGIFKGGLNVGTATGAGTGDGKFSGDVTVGGNDLVFGAGATLTGEADKIVTGNKWVNVGTTGILLGGTVDAGHALAAYSMNYVRLNSRGRVVINVDTDNNSSTEYVSFGNNANNDDDSNSFFKVDEAGDMTNIRSVDIKHYTGGLPAAAVAYRGKIVLIEAPAEMVDILYICLKGSDEGYDWIPIAQGEAP